MGNTTNPCKGKKPWNCPKDKGCSGGYHDGLYICYKTSNGRMDDQMPDIANRFNHLDVERVLRAINGNMLDQDEIQE